MHSTKLMWIIIGTVTASCLFLSGYGLGTSTLGQEISKKTTTYRLGYDAGIEDAKKILNESGILPPARQEFKSITGTITAIDGNQITISGAGKISPNPLDARGPDTRIVKITDKTVIKALVPLSPLEFSTALTKYNKNTKTDSVPPSPYTEKILTFDDLKLTMFITVNASSDIRNSEIINANMISFNATPSTVSYK